MSKEKQKIERWPDDARIRMIEKSMLYSPDERVYQYGYYDGYQLLKEENEKLR